MVDDFVKDDYIGNDGLLYCGMCNQPKQYKFSKFGREFTADCICDCESRIRQIEKMQRAREARLRTIEIMRTNGIQDRMLKDNSFQSCNITANIKKCMKYVDNWNEMFEANEGLLMWGDSGNGKTFAASCIANALIDRHIPVLMTSFPRILNSGFDKNEIVNNMKQYDLVIIDDFGAERKTEYALETVFYVIDERYKTKKPMIITTNMSINELKNPPNMETKRIYDRVLEMCLSMKFTENSMRKGIAEEKKNKANEIFMKKKEND